MNFVEQLKGHRQTKIQQRFRYKCACLFIGHTHSHPHTLTHFRAISICMIDELPTASWLNVCHSFIHCSNILIYSRSRSSRNLLSMFTFYGNRRLVEIAPASIEPASSQHPAKVRQATNSAAVKKLTTSPLAVYCAA